MSGSPVVFKALEVAARAHSGQSRKGTSMPYIVHPIGVMAILVDAGCADEVVAAGVLHDVIEDTALTIDQVRQEFGDRIAALVQAASADKTRSWRERKAHTIETVKTTPDIDLLLLMCADKLDNIRAVRRDYAKVGEALWARFNAGAEDLAWYYGALAETFESRLTTQPGLPLARELRAEVDRTLTRSAGRPIPPVGWNRSTLAYKPTSEEG